MQPTNQANFPDLSLADGGGAIQGLEPHVIAGDFQGSAQLRVPIAVAMARALSPSLSLTYVSGTGNGPYGIGANIPIPSVSRSTGKGIPAYTDDDTITFSETGPLIAKGRWEGRKWSGDTRVVTDEQGISWQVVKFLARQQEGWPAIEQWTRLDDRTSHWRIVSNDNVTTRYGVSAEARVANPDNPAEIAEWLLEEVSDAKGNLASYGYKADGSERYIERIRYGNYRPNGGGDTPAYAFELVFDYGEYDLGSLGQPGCNPYLPVRSWPQRPDRLTSYRHGFERVTRRLCRGVLAFQHFPAELGALPCLSAVTAFSYRESPIASRLSSMSRLGAWRQADGSYLTQALPPVTFTFSAFAPPPAPTFRKLDVVNGPGLAGYLLPRHFQPVDLDGEGLPGFLETSDGSARYFAPLGEGRFAAPNQALAFPEWGAGRDPRVMLSDLDSNGRLELLAPGRAGYFRHADDGSWSGLETFEQYPSTEAAAGLEMVDLTGDGRADLMQLGRTALHYYPSLGRRGYGRMQSADRLVDFPAASANSAREQVSFHDMFGDGLSHRVRVTDGEVAVWPNLGRGRFGNRKTLANAPSFGTDLAIERLYLADLDGSGTADIIIAETDRLLVYRNQAGNGFSAPFTVPLPFRLGANDQLSFADVLGNGSTAVVASRMAPTVEHWFCDIALSDESPVKPDLLVAVDNGYGGNVQLCYASSTSFYLQDRQEGRPWLTRSPFPIQVVTKVARVEAVTGARSTETYRYRDGYFDPVERTFRGFGMVEVRHEDCYEPFQPSPQDPDWPVQRVNDALRTTPTITRLWYETGAYGQAGSLARQNRDDFFAGDPDFYVLPASPFDEAIFAAGGEVLRQACASLAGSLLHSEVYGADETPQAGIPYRVEEHNYQVRLLQPAGPDGHAAFHVGDRESLTYSYERDAADPRIEHSAVLASTLYDDDVPGATTAYERRCRVFYARRPSGGVTAYPEQSAIKASVSESWMTRVVGPFVNVGLPYRQCVAELNGLAPPVSGYFTVDLLAAQADIAIGNAVPYGQDFTPGSLQSRPVSHEQSFYWNDAQDEALPLGEISARALLRHRETAAFPETWRRAVYGDKASDGDLTALAGLVQDADGVWWNPGQLHSYFPPAEPAQFFQICALTAPVSGPGPFARKTVTYDQPYALLPVAVHRFIDATTALSLTALIDYQALQPWQVTDDNGVVRQVLFDPLGQVLASSIFKPADGGAQRVGDGDLRQYVRRRDASFAKVLADPTFYLQDAADYFLADSLAWQATPRQPIRRIALTRTRLVSDNVPSALIEIVIVYSDGQGRDVAAKRICEAASGDPTGALRWQTTGRTVYTDGGEPAQQYLPYYTALPCYEGQQELVDATLAPPPTIHRYDALGRQIRLDTPKGFYSCDVVQAWQVARYDDNDTVIDAPFYIDFIARYPAEPTQRETDEKASLLKAAKFYNTPTIDILDNAGEKIREIQDNLGNVPPDAFTAIVDGTPVTSAELWSALIAAGYLATSTTLPVGTWVQPRFQPYTPGFTLELPAPYDQFARPLTALLIESRLTGLFVVDLLGRLVHYADPRLHLTNRQSGSANVNFTYAYAMASRVASRSDSADAGTRWLLHSVLDTSVVSWDAMGRRTERSFDGLARPTRTLVSEAEVGEAATSRVSEVFTYGEGEPDAASRNLFGQLYRRHDQAGVATAPSYSIHALPVAQTRQLAEEYRTPIDWSGTVPLDATVYRFARSCDALQRVLGETMPDGSVLTRRYALSGRLQAIDVALAHGGTQPFVRSIDYDAADLQLAVAYGNLVTQQSDYEGTTNRLLTLTATRPAWGPGGMPRDPTLQMVAYAYDPVGNVTVMHDGTAQKLFCGGTEPVAQGDYTYDALYRLSGATGLQHPGIDADTVFTGFMQSLYAELCPSDPSRQVRLQPYNESYGYDLSSNLITTHHRAGGTAFERNNPVVATSNRLAGVAYDANGNALQAALQSPTALVWDDRNNLVQAGPVAKSPTLHQHDYSTYDFDGRRLRHVTESSTEPGGAITARRDEITFGDFAVIRLADPIGGAITTTTTLRALDGNTCLVVSRSGADSEIRYQLGDRLGSVTIEARQDGGILSYEAYFPFGDTAIIAGNDQSVVAEKLWRYSGNIRDDSTGFYYYGARYYLPWQGRWLNADPSGASDGANLAQFVGNNPLTYVDGDGRGKMEPDKTDPDRPRLRSVVRRHVRSEAFRREFVRALLHSLMDSPRLAFSVAPRALLDPEARQHRRETARARQIETNNMLLAMVRFYGRPYGLTPEGLAQTARRLRRSWPLPTPPLWLDVLASRREGWPILPVWIMQDRRLRAAMEDPGTWGGMAGRAYGSFLTVGLVLAGVRRIAVMSAPLPVRLLTLPLPVVVGYWLPRVGQAVEIELARDEFREPYERRRLLRQNDPRENWRAWTSYERTLFYMERQERDTARVWAAWNDRSSWVRGGATVLFVGLNLYRLRVHRWPAATHRLWQWARNPRPAASASARPNPDEDFTGFPRPRHIDLGTPAGPLQLPRRRRALPGFVNERPGQVLWPSIWDLWRVPPGPAPFRPGPPLSVVLRALATGATHLTIYAAIAAAAYGIMRSPPSRRAYAAFAAVLSAYAFNKNR